MEEGDSQREPAIPRTVEQASRVRRQLSAMEKGPLTSLAFMQWNGCVRGLNLAPAQDG